MYNFSFIKDFHESRKKLVGASDIPVLFGYGVQYDRTPLTLWVEKTGRAESEQIESEILDWGHIHEHALISRYLTGSAKKADKYLLEVIKNETGFCGDIEWIRKTEFIHPENDCCGFSS